MVVVIIMDPNFDGDFYLQTYPDLSKFGIKTKGAGYKHWLRFGKNEGRMCSKPVVPIPEPIPEPVVEPVVPKAEPIPEPIVVPKPEPIAEPVVPEPIPEPVVVPEPVVPKPEPIPEQVVVPEPIPEPIVVPKPEPIPEPVVVPEPIAELVVPECVVIDGEEYEYQTDSDTENGIEITIN